MCTHSKRSSPTCGSSMLNTVEPTAPSAAPSTGTRSATPEEKEHASHLTLEVDPTGKYHVDRTDKALPLYNCLNFMKGLERCDWDRTMSTALYTALGKRVDLCALRVLIDQASYLKIEGLEGLLNHWNSSKCLSTAGKCALKKRRSCKRARDKDRGS